MEQTEKKKPGRKPLDPKKYEPVIIEIDPSKDPKMFLVNVMNNPDVDLKTRMDAARTLMPFMHSKLGETGKKIEREILAVTAEKGSDWEGLLQGKAD